MSKALAVSQRQVACEGSKQLLAKRSFGLPSLLKLDNVLPNGPMSEQHRILHLSYGPLLTVFIGFTDSNYQSVVKQCGGWWLHECVGLILFRGNGYQTPCFAGPFAVAAKTDEGNQAWPNKACTASLARALQKYDYFDNTVKMLTLLVLSGNWWQP